MDKIEAAHEAERATIPLLDWKIDDLLEKYQPPINYIFNAHQDDFDFIMYMTIIKEYIHVKVECRNLKIFPDNRIIRTICAKSEFKEGSRVVEGHMKNLLKKIRMLNPELSISCETTDGVAEEWVNDPEHIRIEKWKGLVEKILQKHSNKIYAKTIFERFDKSHVKNVN